MTFVEVTEFNIQNLLDYQGYQGSLTIDIFPGMLVEKNLSLPLVRFQLSETYGNRYLTRTSNGNRFSITIGRNIATAR